MEVFYFADSERLPLDVVRDMQGQFNCNLGESENNEGWFDIEELPNHVTVISEDEQIIRELDG